MTEPMEVCEAYWEVAQLALQLGESPLSKHKDCWIYEIDEDWTIAVNGHPDKKNADPEGCMAIDVDPFHLHIWWNGWLAGIFSPKGGMIAHGTEANEHTFIAAVKKKRRSLAGS